MPEERTFQNEESCYRANNHEKEVSTLFPALHVPGGYNGLWQSRRHFYEANLSLTRAARQEKEGDYKAALESGKKAAQLLQSLKTSEPEWNPKWVAGKLDAAAQLQRRVEPLAQKAGAPKKADYSLRPGEQRDFTLQRAYKAHERQKTVVGTVPVLPSSHGTQPGKTVVPASASRPEIRSVKPSSARQESVSRRSGSFARTSSPADRDGRFRIGS